MIRFKSTVALSSYNDPRTNFSSTDLPCEIRTDPLTGSSTRIAHIGMPPRMHLELPSILREKAPPIFSPPLVHQVTPTFPEELIPEGRLTRGKCVLFPNLNPYEVNSPVVAIGDRPYVEADQLDAQDVADALCLMQEFFSRLPPRVAASGVVGWNFLPAAGSSIPHPHIQALASGRTPDRQRRERRGELRYQRRTGTTFWTDLVAAEKGGPRWLGSRRNWSAVMAFAPRTVVPETWLIHRSATSLLDASEVAIAGLADWVVRLAEAHHSEGVTAFNLVLNPTAPLRGTASRLRARFLPRVSIVEPINSSDWVWVNVGTEEGLASITPESWADVLRNQLR